MPFQVGFIGGICLPCYDLLEQVLPSTGPMKEQCAYNLQVWKRKSEDDSHKEEKEGEEKVREKITRNFISLNKNNGYFTCRTNGGGQFTG